MRGFIVTTGSGFIFTNTLHWEFKGGLAYSEGKETGTDEPVWIVLSTRETERAGCLFLPTVNTSRP